MKTNSGKYWVRWARINASNSDSLLTLDPSFLYNVVRFIFALEYAGAKVQVNETKRDPKCGYLFHWSWLISLKRVNPSQVPPLQGVDIQWDHGDKDKQYKFSIQGASEMVNGFCLALPPKSNVAPSLTSNHFTGKAIDMEISWNNKIKVYKADWKTIEITYNHNPNYNENLISLGRSYGVRKLRTDRPHWSYNGR